MRRAVRGGGRLRRAAAVLPRPLLLLPLLPLLLLLLLGGAAPASAHAALRATDPKATVRVTETDQVSEARPVRIRP
ncbi:hypothetical protein ACGFZL_05610 [Streptomyces sp. NPDC048182]|uniref:hypothetical protein n=1 Tax=Streptomyces sp. NPDC048182 TaxID=3365507 RepID=UPI00371359B3